MFVICPQSSQGQNQGFGFTPITGMTSPPVGMVSGMMSPTQMMMPNMPMYTPTGKCPNCTLSPKK